MTNAEQQDCGFRAGVRARHEKSPYELLQVVKTLKTGTQTPYVTGFLRGAWAGTAREHTAKKRKHEQ